MQRKWRTEMHSVPLVGLVAANLKKKKSHRNKIYTEDFCYRLLQRRISVTKRLINVILTEDSISSSLHNFS